MYKLDIDHEPVGQAVNYILSALDIISSMALKAETYEEVAAEEVALGRILSRVQLILDFLDTHRPKNNKLGNKSKLRINWGKN